MSVPEDKDTLISQIVENKKFQIKTYRKIEKNIDIRWALVGLKIEYFKFTSKLLHAAYCGGTGKEFSDTDQANMGFFLRPGVLTFLKTSTELKIWFDDVLEVTWIYADNGDHICVMRDAMVGLKFMAVYQGTHKDKVTKEYRYEIGMYVYHM